MKQLTEKDHKMLAMLYRFIDENQSFTEDTLVAHFFEAVDFAFDNFQEPFRLANSWAKQEYEYELATIALRVGTGLKRFYPKLAKSEKVQNAILEVFYNEKYSAEARINFLYTLEDAKMDKQITDYVKTLSEIPISWGYITMRVLCSRKIGGFSEKVKALYQKIEHTRGEAETRKYCLRYLQNEHKYKQF
ncbi:hypothetical protein CGC48_06845 [Capnocytophaga cynodegmi]|uniref:Uncharacterized protein n=1 Tax=Capnocytophaga cynodegmi TaxID=28189 RepID=A0A250E9G3_9FLAO|nr:hypothetical protein [Capnocytophaga cynodegmi]ATA68367.1 hypothetical protein CGC48_06845 [Capnocytophaga cynodegmi]